jgi:urease accessory protein
VAVALQDGPDTDSAVVFSIVQAGHWDVSLSIDSVVLSFDHRFRRRILLRSEGGRDILLDLPQAVRLRQDDGLVLADGGIVRVRARDEALLEISAASPGLLQRIAWHLGNRHLPVQFCGACLRIRADHVIADMVQGLGGNVLAVAAPFDPEAGAYAGAGGHHHHHHHDGDEAPHAHEP